MLIEVISATTLEVPTTTQQELQTTTVGVIATMSILAPSAFVAGNLAILRPIALFATRAEWAIMIFQKWLDVL
jgi:hypothetical protein